MSTRKKKSKKTEHDLRFVNNGSIVMLHPLTDAGQEWVDEHIPDDAMRLGNAVAIEHRFAGPVIEGAQLDGMRVDLS